MKPSGKHILLVTHEYPPYPGGVGRYCASLAAAATRLGHRITVLAPTHGDGEPSQAADGGVRVERFPGNVFHFRELRAYTERVRAVLGSADFDLVHAADWPALIAVGKIKPKPPCIGTLHGTDILLIRNSIRARLARAGAALSHFERLCCNSRYTQDLLGANFPRLAGRSAVTFLGVDAQWFEPPTSQGVAAFRQRIGFAAGDRVVLTVARLDSRKGQLSTIQALAALPARDRQSLRYVCVGKEVEAGYSETLRHAAAQGGVKLVLTGRIPDDELHAAYSCADVFALTGIEQPRNVEGFGLVLLEAAAQGLPAVVTDVQAIPEVVARGKTGWIAGRHSELTQCFADALAGGRETLRNQCIAHARSYTWERCAAQTYGEAP